MTLNLIFLISKRQRLQKGCWEPNGFKVLLQNLKVLEGTASRGGQACNVVLSTKKNSPLESGITREDPRKWRAPSCTATAQEGGAAAAETMRLGGPFAEKPRGGQLY